MERVQVTLQDGLLITSFTQDDFNAQWEQWLEKLQQLTLLYQGKPEVFFHFPTLPQIELFQYLGQMQDLCEVVGYKNRPMKQNSMKVIHRKIRGGDPMVFAQGALIVNDVERDVFITLEGGNLYVLGCIKGKIECLDETSTIYCQSMEKAMISFKGIWQTSTKLEGPVVYDKNTMSTGLEE